MTRSAPRRRALAAAITSALAVAALAGCATVPSVGDGRVSGDAACEEPRITLTPSVAAPGDEVLVRGEGWGPCNDNPNNPDDPPWTSVSLEWTLGSLSWNSVDVDLDGPTFEQVMTVPADAESAGLMMKADTWDFVARAPLPLTDTPAVTPDAAGGRVLFHDLIEVHYAFLFLASTPDDLGPDIDESLSGQSNGLLGGAVPGSLFMSTGLHTGGIPVRIVVYDSEPALADWDEIVEVSFRPNTPELTLFSFDDAADMWLPVDDYRARWSASGYDEGNAQDVVLEGERAPDSYELALWPAAPAADAVLRVTGKEARFAHEQQQSDD